MGGTVGRRLDAVTAETGASDPDRTARTPVSAARSGLDGAVAGIPETFRRRIAGRQGEVDGDLWLKRLPALVEDHLRRWDLRPDGDAWHGDNALVQPVLRDGGDPAVLKVTWPHPAARHEHLALRAWDGRGAVRLLAANPGSGALLLERLGEPLRGRSVLEACEVVGTLIAELDHPPLPQVDRVADRSADADLLRRGSPLVPRRLSEQAAAVREALLADEVPARLLHEDLHDENVLAAVEPGRGAWLAIDPIPVAAEPAYAIAPMVWNRPDELARAHNLRTHARLRAEVAADAAGLPDDRVRAWTLVRLTLNAVRAAAYAPASEEFGTRMIALAKAFTD